MFLKSELVLMFSSRAFYIECSEDGNATGLSTGNFLSWTENFPWKRG